MADYCTMTELLAVIGKTVVEDTPTITQLITDMSAFLDLRCNRPDGFIASDTASDRLFAGSGQGFMYIDECIEIEGVSVKTSSADPTYTAWDADSFIPFSGDPRFPNFNSTPYTGIMAAAGSGHIFTTPWLSDELSWGWNDGRRMSGGAMVGRGPKPPTVKIRARWGYAETVPGPIHTACLIMAARIWKRGKSAFADTVASVDAGLMFRMTIDPDVQAMLEQGRLIRVVT